MIFNDYYCTARSYNTHNLTFNHFHFIIRVRCEKEKLAFVMSQYGDDDDDVDDEKLNTTTA